MKTTARMSELMNLSGRACLQAGADVQTALLSVNKAIDSIDAIATELEDPSERISWHTVRNVWLEVRASLEHATARFQEKG